MSVDNSKTSLAALSVRVSDPPPQLMCSMLLNAMPELVAAFGAVAATESLPAVSVIVSLPPRASTEVSPVKLIAPKVPAPAPVTVKASTPAVRLSDGVITVSKFDTATPATVLVAPR